MLPHGNSAGPEANNESAKALASHTYSSSAFSFWPKLDQSEPLWQFSARERFADWKAEHICSVYLQGGDFGSVNRQYHCHSITNLCCKSIVPLSTLPRKVANNAMILSICCIRAIIEAII
jgi:hypothetical protein